MLTALCFGHCVCLSRIRYRQLSEIGAIFCHLYRKLGSPSSNMMSKFALEVTKYHKSSPKLQNSVRAYCLTLLAMQLVLSLAFFCTVTTGWLEQLLHVQCFTITNQQCQSTNWKCYWSVLKILLLLHSLTIHFCIADKVTIGTSDSVLPFTLCVLHCHHNQHWLKLIPFQ